MDLNLDLTIKTLRIVKSLVNKNIIQKQGKGGLFARLNVRPFREFDVLFYLKNVSLRTRMSYLVPSPLIKGSTLYKIRELFTPDPIKINQIPDWL